MSSDFLSFILDKESTLELVDLTRFKFASPLIGFDQNKTAEMTMRKARAGTTDLSGKCGDN